MPENENLTPLLPEKRKKNGQFPKGQSPNPGGRPKGALAKHTKFLQIMTGERQKKALKVLDATLRDAEAGDADSRKLVMSVLQPFLKREADKEGGGGDKRPLITVNVGVADGKKPPPVRVIDGKTGVIE